MSVTSSSGRRSAITVPEHEDLLEDFPLHDGAPAFGHPAAIAATPDAAPAPSSGRVAAPLAARLAAAAADAATVLLLAALAILAARLVTGASPKPSGLGWAMGFVLYLWAFATIVPLVAFGKTVGMALADLSARPWDAHPGVTTAAALRRWIGTLATAATGGLLLLWTARDVDARTPADRLSGCALTID
jgi:hypothetical protein